RRAHAVRQRRVHRRRRPRRVDVADPPLDGGRVQSDEAQEVSVPDRAARGVAVHADALAGATRPRAERSGPPEVEIARGEVAQWEHGEPDKTSITLVDAVEVLRHRPLAALHRRILYSAAEHLRARRP